MKKIKSNLVFLFGLFSLTSVVAQIPQAFNYQVVIRDGVDLRKSMPTTIDFEIINQIPNEVVYKETYDTITNEFGLINLQIGMGTPLLGVFSDINWGNGTYALRVLVDGTPFEESKLLAVPFAFYAQSSGGDEDWTVDNQDIFRLSGRVGIGNSNPTERLVVGDDLGNVTGALSSIVIGNNDSNGFSKLVIGENEDNWGAITWRNSNTGTPHTMLLGTSTNGNVRETLSLNRFGRVGVGVTAPSERFVIYNDIGDVTGANAAIILGDENANNISKIVFGEDENHWGGLYWANSNTNKPNSFTFQIKKSPNDAPKDVLTIRQDGVTEVEVLQINGGCDIKEDLNSIQKLEPGDIVIIDQDNPGEIKRTNQPYDKKVAGIISGANGIKPGLSLSQKDVIEGEFPLTMLGRVYVKVAGKVEVGDMITTSFKPGFGMAVKDYSKAYGAVIGKAMTSNEDGEGMVLILVNLQ